MTQIPKTKAIRLNPSQYRKLRDKVWERDNKLCRICGQYTEHAPHHIIFRSQGGSDTMDNMITICYDCHEKVHHRGNPDGWINIYGTADNLQVAYSLGVKLKEGEGWNG